MIAILIAVLLVGFPVGVRAATPAGPPVSAHVYLLRGVLNIFSLGLDQIAAKLRAQGIPVTVANFVSWSSLADEAAAEYRSGRVRTIILVGHSSGATALPDMVSRLDQLGVPVKLAIGLDSVFRTSLQGRVGRYINFYIANGVVLVPTFNDPNDRVALNAIAEAFPKRAVIGIHAVDLVWGLGTLHCLTQQQPARPSGK